MSSNTVVVVVRDMFKDEPTEGKVVVLPALCCLWVESRIWLRESATEV